jgi:hypothetical protein
MRHMEVFRFGPLCGPILRVPNLHCLEVRRARSPVVLTGENFGHNLKVITSGLLVGISILMR